MVDWGVRDSLRGLQGWLLPPLLSLLLIPGHNSSLRQVLHCSAGSLQHQLCPYYYISSHRWTRNTGQCRAFSLRLVDSFQKRNNWYRNRNSRYGKFQNRNTWYENQNRNTKRKLQDLFFSWYSGIRPSPTHKKEKQYFPCIQPGFVEIIGFLVLWTLTIENWKFLAHWPTSTSGNIPRHPFCRAPCWWDIIVIIIIIFVIIIFVIIFASASHLSS